MPNTNVDKLLNEYKRMNNEWVAWLTVGEQFKQHGLDMNAGGNAEDLAYAIMRWGEELVQLRLHQDMSVIQAALQENRQKAAHLPEPSFEGIMTTWTYTFTNAEINLLMDALNELDSEEAEALYEKIQKEGIHQPGRNDG